MLPPQARAAFFIIGAKFCSLLSVSASYQRSLFILYKQWSDWVRCVFATSPTDYFDSFFLSYYLIFCFFLLLFFRYYFFLLCLFITSLLKSWDSFWGYCIFIHQSGFRHASPTEMESMLLQTGISKMVIKLRWQHIPHKASLQRSLRSRKCQALVRFAVTI